MQTDEAYPGRNSQEEDGYPVQGSQLLGREGSGSAAQGEDVTNTDCDPGWRNDL